MKEICPKCETELTLDDLQPGSKFTCTVCKGVFMLVAGDEPVPVQRSRPGCLTCLLPVAVLGISFWVGVMMLWPRIQTSVELGFAAVTQQQAEAQDAYQIAKVRNDDGDDVGEFLFVADMPVFVESAAAPGTEVSFAIRQELKDQVEKSGGVASLGVYSLILYLPDGRGGFEADNGRKPPPLDPATTDARERAFILYAVPNHPGWLGSRSFVADQGQVGPDGKREHQVWFCDPAPGESPYSNKNLPAADAAYLTPAAALDGSLAARGTGPGRDGRTWQLWKPAPK